MQIRNGFTATPSPEPRRHFWVVLSWVWQIDTGKGLGESLSEISSCVGLQVYDCFFIDEQGVTNVSAHGCVVQIDL